MSWVVYVGCSAGLVDGEIGDKGGIGCGCVWCLCARLVVMCCYYGIVGDGGM